METGREGADRADLRTAELDDGQVDATLRRLLEPNPLAVERLVKTALRQGGSAAPAGLGFWWPRLAVAAALVLLAVFLIPGPSEGPRPDGDSPPVVASKPVRLSISNTDGFVTITSAAGSKWILVSGDDS